MAKNSKNTTTNSQTSCPITRAQFASGGAKGTPAVSIGGQPIGCTPKTFSTDSIGYYGNGKVQVMIDGVPVMCQVGLTITVIGSKDLPADANLEAVQAIMDASKANEAREQEAAFWQRP